MYKGVARRILAMVLMCCMISSMPNLALLAAQTGTDTTGEQIAKQPESTDLDMAGENDLNTGGSDASTGMRTDGIDSGTPGSGETDMGEEGSGDLETVEPSPTEPENPSAIDIAGCTVEFDEISRNFTYTGSEITPSVTVKTAEGVALALDTDYTLSYSNNTNVPADNAGDDLKPSVTVTGMGNYKGTITEMFNIVPKTMDTSSVTLTVIENGVYNKKKAGEKAIPPASFSVVDIKTNSELSEEDYIAEYSNADGVGDNAEITITGKRNYIGTVSGKCEIVKASLAKDAYQGTENEITVTIGTENEQFYYKGAGVEVKPTVTVKQGSGDNEVILEENKDYALEYNNNTQVGTASVVIKGTDTGNYEGSREVNFDIQPYDLSQIPANIFGTIDPQLYTGSKIELSEDKFQTLKIGDLTLTKDVDYEIDYDNNIKVGNADVIFTAKEGGSCQGSTKTTFVIYKNIAEENSNFEVTVDSLPYTGQVIEPKPVVTDDGEIITNTEDIKYYTVTSNTELKNAGSYTLTINGDGTYYIGSKTVDFTITKRAMTDLEVRFKNPSEKNEYAFDGNKKEPEVEVVTKGENSIILPKDDFSIQYLLKTTEGNEISENGNAGEYYIKVTPKENINYEGNALTNLTYTITPKEINETDFDIRVVDPTNIIYDGTQKEPKVKVTDNQQKRILTEGTGYSLSYENNIEVGENTGIIRVQGIGNYTGTCEVNFTINKISLVNHVSSIEVNLSKTSYAYTGEIISPEAESVTITVSINGETRELQLSEEDYILTSTAKDAKDTNNFTIEGQGTYYTGEVPSNQSKVSGDKTFAITPKSIEDSDVNVEKIPNQALSGGKAEPNPTITYNGVTLVKGTDYDVRYERNTAIDTDTTPESEKPTAIITGKGNYSGTLSVTFSIRNSIASAKVEGLDGLSYYFSGSDGLKPEPTKVTLNGTELEKNIDYELKYENNVDADPSSTKKPTVRIVGKGIYGGEIQKTFTINRITVGQLGSLENGGSLTLSGNASTVTFTGSVVVPDFKLIYKCTHPITKKSVTYTLEEGKDYTVDAADHIDAEANLPLYVQMRQKNFFRSGSLNIKSYTIQPKNISRATEITAQLENEYFSYDGKPVTPKVTITDLKREKSGEYKPDGGGEYQLVLNKDYTIAYTNNTSPGTATYTITGIGNYTGTKRGNFYIRGDFEGAQVVFTKMTGAGENEYTFTGSQITPALEVRMVSSTGEIKILSSSTDYSVVYPANSIDCGEYEVRIDGKNAYAGAGMSATFKIVQKSLNDTVSPVKIDVKDTTPFKGENINTAPSVTMTLNRYTLTEGKDYTIELEDSCWQSSSAANNKIYSLKIHAKEGSNFTGDVVKSYTIDDNINVNILFLDDNDNVITGNVTRTYTGAEIKPRIRVVDKGTAAVLVEGKDYKVTYNDNINVGKKEIIIDGLADYTQENYTTVYCGRATFKNAYEITKKNLGDNDVVIDDILDQPYSTQQIKPEPTVRWGDRILQVTTEFRYTYAANKDAGVAAGTVTVNGNGNFSGTKSKTFNITKKDITDSDVHIDPIPDQLYIGGQDIKPVPVVTWDNAGKSVKLTAATDYTVGYKQDEDGKSQEVGTVEVTIKGAEKNYTGTRTITFEIVKVPLTDVKAELLETDSKDSYAYTGHQITPNVKLSYTSPNSKGEIIMTPELWGYEISYGQNQFVGTNGTITITAKPDGNCTGSKEVTFKIEKRKLTDEATIRLEPNEIPGQILDPTNEITGVQPEIKVIFYPGADYEPYQLVSGTDCRIEYSNNKAVTEEALVTITGMGNFEGTLTRKFKITQDLTKYITSVEIDKTKPLIYNGEVQYPTLNITFYKGVNLREGIDYELIYLRDGANAELIESGEYTVTIRGLGTYSGELGPYTFEIEKRMLTTKMFHAENQGYNGSPIAPIVTGNDLDRDLVEGVDYVLGEVVNNIDVGLVTVPIQAVETSNYQGSIEVKFWITQTNLNDDFIDVTGLEELDELGASEELKLEYTGSPLSPEITITDTRRDAEGNFIGAESPEEPEEPDDSADPPNPDADPYEPPEQEEHYILLEEKDYTLQWAANQYPGQAEVTITGIGNYKGTIGDHFTIYADLADVKIEPIPVQHYTDEEPIEPELMVTLGEKTLTLNEDYKVEYIYDEDHPDRGEAVAEITPADEEHYIGTNSVDFTIVRSIAEAEIVLPHNLYDETLMDREILYTYTGSPVQPQAVILFNELDEEKSPSTLKLGEDYTITYINNVNVGTANVVVEGIGYFEGSINTTFDITSRSVTRCSFSGVTDVMYDGAQTHQNLVVTEGEKTLEEGKDYRLEYINNVNPGISTITINGVGNYSGVKTIHYLIRMNNMADVSIQGSVDSVNLTWNPIFGAEGYEIYNENNILIAKTTEPTYTHTDLDALTTYQYKVRPYMTSDGATYYGGFSNLVQAQTGMKQPVITLKAKKKAAVVSWQRIKGVNGYEIYRSTKKKKGYKKIKTAKKASIVKYTNKKLTKKKKYYYKIRAYKIVDGKKVYSIYSSPKSVKAK